MNTPNCLCIVCYLPCICQCKIFERWLRSGKYRPGTGNLAGRCCAAELVHDTDVFSQLNEPLMEDDGLPVQSPKPTHTESYQQYQSLSYNPTYEQLSTDMKYVTTQPHIQQPEYYKSLQTPQYTYTVYDIS